MASCLGGKYFLALAGPSRGVSTVVCSEPARENEEDSGDGKVAGSLSLASKHRPPEEDRMRGLTRGGIKREKIREFSSAHRASPAEIAKRGHGLSTPRTCPGQMLI